MNDRDEQVRSQLIEAMLEYMEGRRSFRSVAVIGVTEQSRNIIQNKYVAKVISDLNTMAHASIEGKIFTREEVNEIFTSMLKKLLKD